MARPVFQDEEASTLGCLPFIPVGEYSFSGARFRLLSTNPQDTAQLGSCISFMVIKYGMDEKAQDVTDEFSIEDAQGEKTHKGSRVFIKNKNPLDLVITNSNVQFGKQYAIVDTLVSTELMLVNKYKRVPKEYQVTCLQLMGALFDERIGQDLKELLKNAAQDDVFLFLSHGYRTYEEQGLIYFSYVRDYGKSQTLAARPNESEHRTGLCLDFAWYNTRKALRPAIIEERAATEEFFWLRDNAYKYGFILRYEKGQEAITNVNFEPWHFRYIGKENAKDYRDNKFSTLEEFVSSKK